MRTLGWVSIDQFFGFFYYCHSLRGIILACPGEVKKRKAPVLNYNSSSLLSTNLLVSKSTLLKC